MSDPTPPAGSVPEPDDADTAEQGAAGYPAAAGDEPAHGHTPGPTPGPAPDPAHGPAHGQAAAAPPPPAPPGPLAPPGVARPAVVSRPRWLPMLAAAIMILVLGIGIGVVGTIGVAAISRNLHHRGPVGV